MERRLPVNDVYRAIADPTRRVILDELVARDGQSLFDICGRLVMIHGTGSTRQAISQHLIVLEVVGLARTRRKGRTKLHWINRKPLEAIVDRWTVHPEDENK